MQLTLHACTCIFISSGWRPCVSEKLLGFVQKDNELIFFNGNLSVLLYYFMHTEKYHELSKARIARVLQARVQCEEVLV